jgi:hypothetical protein
MGLRSCQEANGDKRGADDGDRTAQADPYLWRTTGNADNAHESQADSHDDYTERCCARGWDTSSGDAAVQCLTDRPSLVEWHESPFDHRHPFAMPHLQLLGPLPQAHHDNKDAGQDNQHEHRRKQFFSLHQLSNSQSAALDLAVQQIVSGRGETKFVATLSNCFDGE